MADSTRILELETANRQLRHDLKMYQERFKTVFESSGDSIFIVDLGTNRIVAANGLAERRFGYKHDELSTMELTQIEMPVEKSSWVSQDSGTQVYECNYRRKDGTLVPVEVSSRVSGIGENSILVNVARDISFRKKVEAEREQIIHDLDDFAHTVAHDLKTPLSVILGYVTVMAEDETTTDESRDFLERITYSAYKMRSIIDELLLFSNVNKTDVTLTPLDMGTLVIEAIKRVEFIRQRANATITAPDTWPNALGYGPWIEEVWVNFISNAIKYGGTPPKIEVGATQQDNNTVCFWVRDNGEGIAPEHVSELFQEFARLNTTPIEGHGLGLSIVRRIIEKLGGTVHVESTVGQGSIFSFTLPAAK
jgi:PAS domain S-box-containing protein